MWVIIVIVVIVLLVNSNNKKKAEAITSGQKDTVINQILAAYARMREHCDEIGSGVLSVGQYFFDRDGKPDSSSSYLAVAARDETGAFAARARQLGFNVDHFNGTYLYQIPIKVPLSGKEKQAALERTAQKLRALYPNDAINVENHLLTSMVDMKDKLEWLNKHMKS